jgi:pyruvate dehydrogenase E2 component (dihydrolipoamide acetyltransferase)
MYEIVMPQLSDSMDEGKLIAWKVDTGDRVKSGDVIAEVESDKAIMEVQSFQDGVVEALLAKEGDTLRVGSVIAKIATQNEEAPKEALQEEKKESREVVHRAPKKESHKAPDTKASNTQEGYHSSPKARMKAQEYGVDIERLAQNTQEEIVHAKDVDMYALERYFTPKARKLLDSYNLKSTLFKLDHKIDEQEVRRYVKEHQLLLIKTLDPMQKALISNVTLSAQKPVFHIYESLDAALIQKHQNRTVTLWIIKAVAKVMMQHEAFRSKIVQERVQIVPYASISLAVSDKKALYMPVLHQAEKMSADTIGSTLQNFKNHLQKRSFRAQDLEGATFGISNLGMLGIERFDAMINRDESAILAVGALKNGKIALTLTADHRLVNGYEAALFMQDLKKELQSPLNFKE